MIYSFSRNSEFYLSLSQLKRYDVKRIVIRKKKPNIIS